MLQINCPWCGIRDEPEFTCGGVAPLIRPPLQCDDAEWANYLYFRDNPKGLHRERWRHSFGCGQWFMLVRNTATHEITSATCMDGPAP
jgi:sarcosine oxidase, subunit delta